MMISLLFLALMVSKVIMSAEAQGFLRNAEISLTCNRVKNPCLENTEGSNYSILSKLIEAALEVQEYEMNQDAMSETRGESASDWIFEEGKWTLVTPGIARRKRIRAERNYKVKEEFINKQQQGGVRGRRDLEDLNLSGSELADVLAEEEFLAQLSSSSERELMRFDFCGYNVCLDNPNICAFYCAYRDNGRQRDLAAANDEDGRCVAYTDLASFLHRFPTESIDECVTDTTICQLSHPCSA